MPSFLVKLFIKDHENYSSPKVRNAYGMLCGALGIFLNIVLFIGKLLCGILSGSIAVTADAVNNLSDAGSSLIMLIGFKLAGQKPDLEHPFGHGRIEYISGLIVSLIVILMGFELGKSSFAKITEPTLPTFDILAAVILVASILVKLYMFLYNRITAKKISSEAMLATSYDSLSDSASTLAVLISMLLAHFWGIAADGWCGLLVSGFIIFSGIRSVAETVSPLLGQPADHEFAKQIEAIVRDNDTVKGIHDMIIHSYGPGVLFVSLHAEVPANGNILDMHETIDNIERRLEEELHCRAVIHMDPIETDNKQITETRAKVEELVRCIDERFTIHDFRMVSGTMHTNVIFDLVVPYDFAMNDKAVVEKVTRMISVLNPAYFAVIDIDRTYVN